MFERKDICITYEAFKIILTRGDTFEGYVKGVGYAYIEIVMYDCPNSNFENINFSHEGDMYCHTFKFQRIDFSRDAIRKSLKFIFIGSTGYPTGKLPTVTNHMDKSVEVENSEISYYENALQYEGIVYELGGMSRNGIDCSGLICLAVTGKFERTWSTKSPNPPPGKWEKVIVSTTSNVEFEKSLKKGDLLLWKEGGHVAFYAGNGSLFHACGSKNVAKTINLQTYWLPKKGLPSVFRQKK